MIESTLPETSMISAKRQESIYFWNKTKLYYQHKNIYINFKKQINIIFLIKLKFNNLYFK